MLQNGTGESLNNLIGEYFLYYKNILKYWNKEDSQGWWHLNVIVPEMKEQSDGLFKYSMWLNDKAGMGLVQRLKARALSWASSA